MAKRKKNLSNDIKYYYKIKNELFLEDDLVFFNERIFVPQKLRLFVLELLHKSHMGIEKTRQRARSLVYWPGIDNQIEEIVMKCSICQKYRSSNIKEPLINHSIPEGPYQKIGMDIMEISGKNYLVIGDYFSKYLDIIYINSKTTTAVISKLEVVFSIYGIPKTIIADNVPFGSFEFKNFAKNLDIVVITTSPNYPKSNGFAERCVQIAKKLILKSNESKTSLWLALLEHRNTPIKNSKISPAQLMMGRQTRSLIPGKEEVFKNENLCKAIVPILQYNNIRNKNYHDLNAKSKRKFQLGEKIWYRDGRHWQPAMIKSLHSTPRSYVIELPNGKTLRRNSYFLRERS